MGVILLLVLLNLPATLWADKYKFDWKWRSRSTVDSTRKDYYDLSYDPITFAEIITPKSFDKSFISSINDLSFTLKGDLSPTQILDFKENLHYQKYQPQDYNAYALDTYKYSYLDHQFNVTYGLSLGKSDAISLDYINTIYQIPIDNLNEYLSHLGKARFNHKINKNTSLGFEGDFEEREYQNDSASNYREAALLIDFSEFFPERVRYRPVSNATRGDKSTFTQVPSGMSTKKAVDYYTDWTRPPSETNSEAKYVAEVVRGDLYVDLVGDFRTRQRPTIDNVYYQPSGITKITYDASDKLKFALDNTYYQRTFKLESDYYYLYDHKADQLSFSSTYRPDSMFTHILTYGYEMYDHVNHKEMDYRVNSFKWETYYTFRRHNASVYFRDGLQRYGIPRAYYPDSNQLQGIFSYDYTITKTFFLHLKDEWANYDYLSFENLFYSTYDRNTWKVSFEKDLTKSQALELGYQNKRESHKTFYSNDITEKTVFFTWTSNL